MRTTLNLDEVAIDDALAVSPGRTKTHVINEALREYARRRRVRAILEHEGRIAWEGDLDELRRRRPAG